MKSILHNDFHYTPASHTDIRKSIRKEQRRLAAIQEAQAKADAEAVEVVAKRRVGKVK